MRIVIFMFLLWKAGMRPEWHYTGETGSTQSYGPNSKLYYSEYSYNMVDPNSTEGQ